MINRINAIREKKSRRKILLYITFLAVLIGISYYQFILQSEGHFITWLFYTIQMLYTAIFGIPLLFLIYLTVELEFPLKQSIYLIRIGGRNQLFWTDVSFLFKLLFRFFICLLLMIGVIGISTQAGYFYWNKEGIAAFTSVLRVTPNTQVSPFLQIGIAWLFLFLYLFFMANSFILLSFITKSRAVTFLTLFFFIGLQAYFYKSSQDTFISRLMPFTHYLLYTGTEPIHNFFHFALKNLLHWGLSISVIDGILFYCYTHKSVGE